MYEKKNSRLSKFQLAEIQIRRDPGGHLQGLVDVAGQVGGVLKADREADDSTGDPALALLLRGEELVAQARGVAGQAVHPAQADGAVDNLDVQAWGELQIA